MQTRTEFDTGLPVITRVSGDTLHPTNAGRLCTKGATHAELMAATDGRLTTALMRSDRDGEFAEVDVDDAVAEAGRRLRAIVDEHGPDAVALYVSGQMSIEAQYVATKLAKGFVRTTHLESNSRLCMASAATGFKQSLGADGPPGSYADFDTTDLFFVIGSNMADCHPILYLRMVDRLKAGARLIVVDPRRTTTADHADLHLPIRPGTDLALLNGILHLLVINGDVDADFIAEHTEGWDPMPEFLADYPPHVVARITGLAEDDIRTAATMIAEAGDWTTCWTMGLNQSTHGTWNTNAICNLHLATGAICRPGSGPMSLTGQPNAMGGREMGYMGPGLPGQRTVTSPADRAFVETRWGLAAGTIRSDVGPGTIEMFERMAAGDVKACWVICTNPVASVANRSTVIDALRTAELVVTQDAYRDTATNRYADVVLPATLWAESDAVMVNSERTLTLMAQSVPAPGQAMPDWQLICRVAEHMGFGADFAYASSEEIFAEIREFSNPRTGYDLRGASYDRLRETPLQWPVAPGGADRNPTRYLNDGVSQDPYVDADGHRPRLAFPTPSRRAVFHPRPHVDPAERPDGEYPIVLNTGRLQHQWHTMTKTGRIAKLNKLNPGPFVEVHPDDAVTLDVVDGGRVELTSRRGRAIVPAVVTDRVLAGTCFVPFHWNDEHGADLTINALTSDAVDPDSLQPEFKACAVRLTAVTPDTPAPPLPDDVVEDVVTDGPLVLWASQTGTAEDVASRVAGRICGARLIAMDQATPADLSEAGDVVIVTSTFGAGGPPDNGAGFWDRLSRDDQPALDGVRYAVLGIGDRSYDDFCGYAKSLDRRLSDLGASTLLDRTECEAYDDEPMARWTDRVSGILGRSAAATDGPPSAAVAEPFTRHRPLRVPLGRNVLLTPPTADKEVRLFGFDVSEHDVTYSVGDALGVYVVNAPEVVDAWLSATGLAGSEAVHVDGEDVDLRDALSSSYDVCRVTPNLLSFMAERCGDGAAARMLTRSSSERDAWLVGRNGLDVVEAFAVRAEPAEWLDALVRLTPRSYSIASSPLVSPHEVQTTVSVVRYRSPSGARRGGVSSTFLADRATHAEVFLQPSPHFRPPEDGATPMIMVGPGTGVAPFRGFLQERRALGHIGRNWLFFGDRHRAENFYFRDDLEDMVRDGLLDRLDLAFSRDQAERRYLQHDMTRSGADLWRWLCEGAHLYVCGDAARMAKDVDDALTAIIRRHGHLSADAARDYKRELVATKRYVRDVY
ncbi:bifunctional nitrate reductase/sulfite reductase flavoprotein subunit alpha [Mycolicibacterium sediminis]|uniref:assimilatory sulfite reductase (NADPH) n=1 Tax=Mycolicibacterium sediminis TaxID=1286180 RepID=A0A7I7QXD5_9MYCO|nr:putative oxidoreductase [Mycolicibacterium sediminis]